MPCATKFKNPIEVYVGNLSFTTRSTHLHNHFQHLGPVVQVHIGLDRHKKTPCGFAFVEFRHRIDALSAVVNLTGTKLDGRVIRVELDAGFKPGREYGRGASGGQVRDDRGGGSGRDRRNNNNNSSSVGGGGNERPRWEPPSAPKADDVGHYERGGGGEGRDISDSRAGEKRGREDATMEQEQEDDENNSGNNQKMYHYDDDENL
ncbi:hypothetical protein ACHAXS_008087 [Conticribra weissflogii]